MRIVLAICLALAPLGPASATNLKLLTAGAYRQVAEAVIPAFEKETGHKVTIINDTAGGLSRRIAGGEKFDVVVLTLQALDPLVAAKKLTDDPVVPLARVGIGVGSSLSGPVPDIFSVEGFRKTLLAARKVAYMDPSAGATSGIYLTKLWHQLGIANEMREKAVLVRGGFAGQRVASGEAEIALQQASEIRAVPSIRFAGLIPAQIQSYTVYAGAIGTSTSDQDAAGALLTALANADLMLLKKKGMDVP
jgi:molybdate transport system substrate-binding protein